MKKADMETAANLLHSRLSEISEQDAQKGRDLFTRQEQQFAEWTRSYYEAGFFFYYLSTRVGEKAFRFWLAQNFFNDQIAVIEDMLDKLQNTATGQQILKTVTHPDNFVFPS
jgi:hypothetical protein